MDILTVTKVDAGIYNIPMENKAHIESEPPSEIGQQTRLKHVQWTRTIILTTVASSLGAALPGGYCIGVINSTAEHMRDWCKEILILNYGLQIDASTLELLWSTIVSITLVGGMLGSFNGARLANRLGRRGCWFLSGLLYLVGGICFLCCRTIASVELLLIGRLIVGLAAGITTTCLPMYHNEIAATSQRGILSVACAMGFTIGLILSQICTLQIMLGNANQWHFALSFYIIFVVLFHTPVVLYPESPKWLCIIKNRREETELVLRRLRGNVPTNIITQEIEEMEMQAKQKNQVSGYRKVLSDKRLLLPMVLLCSYQGGQQLSGINSIFYYSVLIFRKAGFTLQAAELMNLCAGSVNLSMSMMGPLLMAKFNRRTLMMVSSSFCSLFLLAFALLFQYISEVQWFAYGCAATIFLYIISFQIALGTMPSFIGAELFEVSPRPAAMSFGNIIGWGCNFLVGMTFPTMQNLWGSWIFLFFSINCALLFILTKLYLPETKGGSPTEIAGIISHGFKSKIVKDNINVN